MRTPHPHQIASVNGPRSTAGRSAGMPIVTQSAVHALARAISGASAADPLALLAQYEQVVEENQQLRDELGRCYKHLSVVFEITDKISRLRDPYEIEREMLRCYAEMLRADYLLIASGRSLRRLHLDGLLAGPPPATPDRLADLLQDEIKRVRQQPRTLRLRLDQADDDALHDWQGLLAGLTTTNDNVTVLLTLRSPGRTPFDAGDELVSETALAYGGHVLRNAIMVRHIQRSALETVRAFANAVDARDTYTCGHCERVGWLARQVGERLGLTEAELDILEWSGILHDVGKIGVPEQILNKAGALSEIEFEQIRRHPRLGYDVLKPVSSLEPVLGAVLYHHENYDGSGYPTGIAGENIPRNARIIRVVDTFDALTSTRSYRHGRTIDEALAIIERDAGTTFDPHIAILFADMIRTFRRDNEEAFIAIFGHLLDQTEPEPAGALYTVQKT